VARQASASVSSGLRARLAACGSRPTTSIARPATRSYGPGSGADFLQGEGPASVLRFEDVLWLRQVGWGCGVEAGVALGVVARPAAVGQGSGGRPPGSLTALTPPRRRAGAPAQVCLPPESSLMPEARAAVSNFSYSAAAAGGAAGGGGGLERVGPVCFNGTCYADNVVRASDASLLITPVAPDLDTSAAPVDRRYTWVWGRRRARGPGRLGRGG
jgi:hypothetical protein